MNIPTVPGLDPHPTLVAEQQRLAEEKKAEIDAGIVSQQDTASPDGSKRSASILSERTRTALTKLAQALRKAGGIAEPPPAVQPAALTPGTTPNPQQPSSPAGARQAPAAVSPPSAPQLQPGTKPEAKPETKPDAKSDKRAANGTATPALGSLEPNSALGRAAAAKPADAAPAAQKPQEAIRRGN